MEDKTTVLFRYGTPVTYNSPSVIAGSFVFDSAKLALYLDTESGRVQVQDPLKLSLTGGTIAGNIELVEYGQVNVSLLRSGTVTAKFVELTGDLYLDSVAEKFALLDEEGKIRYRTKDEILSDLNIDTLGKLAYQDSVTGEFTPEGSVSAPEVTINYDTHDVVDSINPIHFEVVGENLILTEITTNKVSMMKEVTSVDVSTPVFTGTQGTVTSD